MAWNLLSKEEIRHINEKVMEKERRQSELFNPAALSAATEGEGFDYEENLSGAAYLVAVAIAQEHPFADGNKRTAVKAVKKFLKRNGRIPTEKQMVGIRELVDRLADEDPIEKKAFITGLEHILSLGDLTE